jgi:hypothetical protein
LEKRWHKNRIFAGLHIIALAAVILAGCTQAGTDEHPVISSEMSASASSEAAAPADRTSSFNENKTSGKGETPGVLNQNEDKSEEAEKAMRLYINDEEIFVAWEDNESVSALRELVSDDTLRIEMSMYGGFEQVGSIGQNLPKNDVQTTTSAGDIVLYSGNQIVVFYGSNSWAYTRLGKITDKSASQMKELLGNGDVTITFTR